MKTKKPAPCAGHTEFVARSNCDAPIDMTLNLQCDDMIHVVIMKSIAYRAMSDIGEV
jgi:hypothetical protein